MNFERLWYLFLGHPHRHQSPHAVHSGALQPPAHCPPKVPACAITGPLLPLQRLQGACRVRHCHEAATASGLPAFVLRRLASKTATASLSTIASAQLPREHLTWGLLLGPAHARGACRISRPEPPPAVIFSTLWSSGHCLTCELCRLGDCQHLHPRGLKFCIKLYQTLGSSKPVPSLQLSLSTRHGVARSSGWLMCQQGPPAALSSEGALAARGSRATAIALQAFTMQP
jgi:hypothetical protein